MNFVNWFRQIACLLKLDIELNAPIACLSFRM